MLHIFPNMPKTHTHFCVFLFFFPRLLSLCLPRPPSPFFTAALLRAVQALGWHSWRAHASRAIYAPADPDSPSTRGASPNTAAKVTLAEGHNLLNAVSQGRGSLDSSGSGGSSGVPVLEGTALAQAAASHELAVLNAVVLSKDAAVRLAWGGRKGGVGGSGGRGGWGSAFPAAPLTTWREAVAIGGGGGDGGGGARQRWNSWHSSVTGLVDGMQGVLVGLVEAAPSLRSCLETHLETRWVVLSRINE